mmetsp:Transcript_4016/g.6507  ORF Transcript_4016/g.6507 Transcript_4016/m.6507 type:complete len:208 (+) Transcript_4016:98-721(+)
MPICKQQGALGTCVQLEFHHVFLLLQHVFDHLVPLLGLLARPLGLPPLRRQLRRPRLGPPGPARRPPPLHPLFELQVVQRVPEGRPGLAPRAPLLQGPQLVAQQRQRALLAPAVHVRGQAHEPGHPLQVRVRAHLHQAQLGRHPTAGAVRVPLEERPLLRLHRPAPLGILPGLLQRLFLVVTNVLVLLVPKVFEVPLLCCLPVQFLV